MSVTWITGNSGAGKTTLARKLLQAENAVLLDGDEIRSCWQHDQRPLGLSREDRVEHNLRVAHVARVLAAQGVHVIVATICPYRDLRALVQSITGCRFIYLPGGRMGDPAYPYEPPGEDGL